ncbi:MAG: hypothetical protein ACE5EN_09060 [Nitrospinota bacterium]
MKKSVLVCFALVLIVTFSCTGLNSYRYRQMYALVKPVENYDRFYEDDNVAFRFEVEEKKIHLFVTNKSEKEIRLNWPDVRFIDPGGKKHQVANLDTVFTKNTERIKPTAVSAGMTEENLIVPLDSMDKIEQWTWTLKPFFNQEDDKALLNKNKTFSIIFPVEFDESEKRTYRFDFKVTNVIAYRGRNPG